MAPFIQAPFLASQAQTDMVDQHPNEALKVWSKHSVDVVAHVLKASGRYTVEEQEAHIGFITNHVLPKLGAFESFSGLTYHGCPFETSLNFTSRNGPAVRFCFEPTGNAVSARADASLDPSSNALKALRSLAEATPNIFTHWAKSFAEGLFLRQEELSLAHSRIPPKAGHIPQCLIAFDLDGGERSMKLYFFPILKHIVTKTDTNTLVFGIVRDLEPLGSGFAPAIKVMDAYFREQEAPVSIDIVTIDCIDPTIRKARVKLYIQTKTSSFASVRNAVTLGGRVQDPTTVKGLVILRSIWHLLLDEPQGVPEDDSWSKPPNDPDGPRTGLVFGFEMEPGSEFPSVKVYVPMWQYSRSDGATAENYGRIFEKLGWDWGQDGRLGQVIGACKAKAGTKRDTHTFTSFAYTNKGPYITSYFSLPL